MSEKSTANLSLPQSKNVRGYEIKRLPLGKMIKAAEMLQDIPGGLMQACFPGAGAGEILTRLKSIDKDLLLDVVAKAAVAAPSYIVRVVSQLTEIEERALLEDEQVGMDGLAEIAQAWVEVNNIEGFTGAVRGLREMIRTALGSSRQQSLGSNA